MITPWTSMASCRQGKERNLAFILQEEIWYSTIGKFGIGVCPVRVTGKGGALYSFRAATDADEIKTQG